MTGRTIAAHDIHIMDKSADECSKADANGVTRRAVQVRRYMIKGFTHTDIAVMAEQAVTGIGARMVKRHTSKGRGVMANVAFLVVRSGRYVVREFTHTDPVIVARGAAASSDTGMIIGASTKGPRGMAVATILVTVRARIVWIGWHVRIERCGKWFACGSNLR
jgi:hypothetical protein